MSANYAHMILVESLCRQAASIPNLTPAMVMSLQNHTPFCKLGAVSPDCPEVVGSTGATGYAKIMHHLRTADFVRYAVPQIYSMNFSLADTRACLAWIFGYVAHLVTDLTVHPVISRKFGDYAKNMKNKQQHRFCEFHQDVHLYHKLYGQEIVGSDFLKFSGLAECAVNRSTNKLHPVIVDLWTHCLEQYPRSETKAYVSLPSQSLKPNVWYATHLNLFKTVVTKGNPFLQGIGFGYPDVAKLNSIYLRHLPTTSGTAITCEELFEAAKQNIKATWATLALALDSNQPALLSLPNADLVTGRADATGQLVMVV
jgi:hypothetical protein